MDQSHPFKEFLTKSNILAASLALIVSMQFTSLLESVFYDIIDPIIVYLVYGNNDYSFKTYVVSSGSFDSSSKSKYMLIYLVKLSLFKFE